MTTHTIELERRTLHGTFSRELEPILTINSGDTVIYETLDAGWTVDPSVPHGQPGRTFEPRDRERDAGHALCGPVAVRGAEPGMTLEVRTIALRPGRYAWTVAGGWPSASNDRLGVSEGETVALRWSLDPDTMTGRDQHGHTVRLQPFMGVMGMPPDEPGFHSTAPPRASGGNIDCTELGRGSSLFLPIPVPDALFSVGDGHARQGDGEVSHTAMECPMGRVELQLIVHPELHLSTPRARTPTAWITFGFHEKLDEATMIAVESMLDLMRELHGLERREALALASVIVDLRITQIVNGVRGAHAMLPHDALL